MSSITPNKSILRNFKQEFIDNSPLLRKRVKDVTGENSEEKTNNPFLNSKGELLNKYINYQQVLNNPNVAAKVKALISQATGLTPSSAPATASTQTSAPVIVPQPVNSSGVMENSVGKKIANTGAYNNNAAKGQCVWYVRGRASEKLGKDTGAIGNANQMWYNAKADAKLSATADNIKPNVIVSYKTGTGSVGQSAGHVIFVEDVVGDTVYYTEGGSGYYKNGTDGVVKTASKQGILNGVNTSGARMGSGVIGFIDLSKY